MGRRLELNPFAVFLAIAFCTWLWGPVGAFVAVPLLIALTVTLGHALADDKPDSAGLKLIRASGVVPALA